MLSQKPVISDDVGNMDPTLLEMLLRNLATLSSVYHKPPEIFVSRQRLAVQKADELQVWITGKGAHTFSSAHALCSGLCLRRKSWLSTRLSDPLSTRLDPPWRPSCCPTPIQGHKFEDEDAGSSPKGDSSAQRALDAQPSVASAAGAPVVDLLGGLSEPVAAAGGVVRAPQGGIEDLLGGLDVGGPAASATASGQPQLPVLLSDPAKGVVVQVSQCGSQQHIPNTGL